MLKKIIGNRLNEDFEYKFEIQSEEKIKIILTKYNQYWNGMIVWEDKAFNTSKWFSGIILAPISYLISQKGNINFDLKVLLVSLLFIFGFSTMIYLLVCMKAYHSNYIMSIYIENILKFYKKDEYLKDNFLLPKELKKTVKVKQLYVLIWAHIIMIITSSIGILII